MPPAILRIARLRSVLFDLNLRAPGVAAGFGLLGEADLSRFLLGELPLSRGLVCCGTNLALGLADGQNPASAELLHDGRTGVTIGSVQSALDPDLMLFDLPPALAYDDLSAFLPQVDGVLLVADAGKTTAHELAECERMISGQTKLLGVVLNKSENSAAVAESYAHGRG